MPMFFFFFPVAAIALIGAHYYFYRRLIRPLPNRVLRIAGLILILTLLVLVSFGTVLYRILPAATTLHFQRLSYVWMTIGLYCLFVFVMIDLVALTAWVIGRFRRRQKEQSNEKILDRSSPTVSAPSVSDTIISAPSVEKGRSTPLTASYETDVSFREDRRRFLMNSGLFGLSLALPTSGWGFWSAQHCQVLEVPIHLEKLPKHLSGFSIALLSDIHAGGWIDRAFVQDLVNTVNVLRPDAVFIAGDLVDGDVPSLAHIVAPLAELRARLGTFFVIGNHEIYSGVEPWQAYLTSLGIRVLRNERIDLEGLDLIGLDDWSAASRGILPGYDLDAVLAQRNPECPALLLTHQPRGFRTAAEKGIDLQLSGHTHGGQLFPFHPIARHANDGFLAGRYRHQKGQLYVTRGCGYWGPPARVGAPPEITHIALLPGSAPAR